MATVPPPVPPSQDLQAQLTFAHGQIQQLQVQRDSLQQQLVQTQAQTVALQNQRDQLTQQMAGLQQTLAQVQASSDQRVQTAVKAALDQASADNAAALAQAQQERDQLQARINQIQSAAAAAAVAKPLQATTFAQSLATVLQNLSAPPPKPGEQFAVALTTLEVEARGLLSVPEGQQDVYFAPIDAPGIDPNLLSTVRLTFRPIPRPGSPPTSTG